MDKKVLIKGVVQNALGFIEYSVNEIKTPEYAKFSLIHFCTAIELFVKARLMSEHWVLILTKPEAADLQDFYKGKLHSVSLVEGIRRLEKILGEEFRPEEKKCFESIVKHRNQLMHFHHPDQNDLDAFRTKVSAEQLRAWFYLYRLLTGRWQTYFTKLKSVLDKLDRKMQGLSAYLQEKYELLKPDINQLIQDGERIDNCPSCGYRALSIEAVLGPLTKSRCKVCEWISEQIEFTCPYCQRKVSLKDMGEGNCDHCGKRIEPQHITKQFAQESGDNSFIIGNCKECESHHTVIPCEGKYLCTYCFYISDVLEECPWCNELLNSIEFDGVPEGCFRCSSNRERWFEKQ